MNTYQEHLVPGCYYHIYNRGNNREVIFKKPENYAYFLHLWKKYITPVADTLCYCLLPNHFHFFIRIKGDNANNMEQSIHEIKKDKPLSKHFSNLFNAYAKAINKKYNRVGSLFQENFKRKEIINNSYYTNLIAYIITNPVKHGICNSFANYPHSAYKSLLSDKPTLLLRDEVINWFESKKGFVDYIRNYEAGLQI